MNEKGLNVKEAAALTGLSAHTLRYYERVGLLDPISRASSGHRRYSEQDTSWIEFLGRLQTTGMPIRKMKRFVDLRRGGDPTVPARRALLEEHRIEVRQRMVELERVSSTNSRIFSLWSATARRLLKACSLVWRRR